MTGGARGTAAFAAADTIEELRAALVVFAGRYNEAWLVDGYSTRAQIRSNPGLIKAPGLT